VKKESEKAEKEGRGAPVTQTFPDLSPCYEEDEHGARYSTECSERAAAVQADRDHSSSAPTESEAANEEL
jgi:hypothetical protein